jgi:hypothetical protein
MNSSEKEREYDDREAATTGMSPYEIGFRDGLNNRTPYTPLNRVPSHQRESYFQGYVQARGMDSAGQPSPTRGRRV